MEAVVLSLLLTVVIAAIVWGIRQIGSAGRSQRSDEPWRETAAAGGRIVLDLVADDPSAPAIQRLAFGAGRQALHADPALDRVEVVDREGARLTIVRRDQPLPPELEIAATLHEPHRKGARGPAEIGSDEPPGARATGVAARPWSQRFDLPPAVVAAITDDERPADVIRAILATAGLDAVAHGNLVRVGDTAVVVIPDVRDGATEAINHAYLQYKQTDAEHAILVRLGYVDPEVIRRHDAATPDVRHIGAEGVQRMADAVGVGADPLAFAVGPAVLR